MILVDPDGKDAIVTIDGNTITVSSEIYIYGSGASDTEAKRIEKAFNSAWNGSGRTYTDEKGNEYKVVFSVSVAVLNTENPTTNPLMIPDAFNPSSRNNYIELNAGSGRDFVSGGDEGVWNTSSSDWVFAHEFGYLAGLNDRYKDNASGVSVADPGWAGNMMGSYGGRVDQRNIDGIVSNAVTQYLPHKEERDKVLGTNRRNKAITQWLGLPFSLQNKVPPSKFVTEINDSRPKN